MLGMLSMFLIVFCACYFFESDLRQDYEEYSVKSILPGDYALEVIQNELNLPWSAYIGAAGGTGQPYPVLTSKGLMTLSPGFTAWAGWKHFSKAKKVSAIQMRRRLCI